MKQVHGVVLGLTPQPVRSSYSTGYNNCVEISSRTPVAVEVTDSKLEDSPELVVSPEAWRQMLKDVTGR